MDDLKKGLRVEANDPIDAAGLRFERLYTLIQCLADEADESADSRAGLLTSFLLSEIHQAREEQRFLLLESRDA